METILDEAKGLIYGDRQEQYGGALESFTKIAQGWSIITGTDITAEQTTLMMDWLKTCRLLNQPGHHDSIVDKAGYAGCYEKIINERAHPMIVAKAQSGGPIPPLPIPVSEQEVEEILARSVVDSDDLRNHDIRGGMI